MQPPLSTQSSSAQIPPQNERGIFDVAVIGGGQAGLAVSYYLRRTGLRFCVLDAQQGPGGAWQRTWDSLTLFSPAQWSSLPGWIMPGGTREYPGRDQFLAYVREYEARYSLPVFRPVQVSDVRAEHDYLVAESDVGEWRARTIVSGTGNWGNPYIPSYPGRELFRGISIHSASYISPKPFAGKRVLVVGGGNSGAQILAEVSKVANATWVTRTPPVFMADDVDGRVLFDLASRRFGLGQDLEGSTLRGAVTGGLGNIVMLPAVREARSRGVLTSVPPFQRFTSTGVVWPDGHEETIDVVIWCTGFRPNLAHLEGLNIVEPDGTVSVEGTRSLKEPRLWLVGYGDWTGYASATVIGVGRSARSTVAEIEATLKAT